MSVVIAVALLASQPAVQTPPPGLLFGFYRIAAFRHRAKELRCGAAALDGQFEEIRKKLAGRYGKKAFSLPKMPRGGPPGDCQIELSVYSLNLGEFRKEAEAALSASAPGTAPRTEKP
jgi:hypothetical protein